MYTLGCIVDVYFFKHILQRAEWWILAVDMSGPVAGAELN